MINETIDLYEYFNIDRKGASGGYLTVYAYSESRELTKMKRPAMLVIPGGGYEVLSDREGEPIAMKFTGLGFASFVLSYSIRTKYPVPLYEAELAAAYIRKNADKYNVDSDKLCAIGFSAGGHLAGMLATLQEGELLPDLTEMDVRPNAAVLSYPVVTMGELTHSGTRRVITGGDELLCDKLSVEKRVDGKSAPAFIWHTMEDSVVPVENSMMLAEAYRRSKVPFSLMIFEKGYHGLSLANDEVCRFSAEEQLLRRVGKWVDSVHDWLLTRGFERH